MIQRQTVEVQVFPKTRTVTLLLTYNGEWQHEEDTVTLLGDAWHSLALERGVDPVAGMQLIDQVKGGKP